MPLGSSSAAPVIKPGPSCFSSGNRAAGFPAAAETAASRFSFAVMAAVGERRGALRQCTEKILTVVILSAHVHAMFRDRHADNGLTEKPARFPSKTRRTRDSSLHSRPWIFKLMVNLR